MYLYNGCVYAIKTTEDHFDCKYPRTIDKYKYVFLICKCAAVFCMYNTLNHIINCTLYLKLYIWILTYSMLATMEVLIFSLFLTFPSV